MENEGKSMKTQNIFLGIFIGIALAVATMFYIQTQRAIDAYICDSRSIIVRQGDTMFDLVTQNCDGNLSRALDDAVDRYGTNLAIGQQVFLPQNNDCYLYLTDGGEVAEDC